VSTYQADGYSEDNAYCDDCGRRLDLGPCVCTFHHTPEAIPERRYKVFRENETHGVPYLSEMFARLYAAKFGGRVEEDGVEIATYPVPAWVRRIEALAHHAAPHVHLRSADDYAEQLRADSLAWIVRQEVVA